MPTWKKNIFISAIRARMAQESRTAEDIITDYPALTEDEKAEILAALSSHTDILCETITNGMRLCNGQIQ